MRGLSASVAVSLGVHLALGAVLLALEWQPPPVRRATVRLVALLTPVREAPADEPTPSLPVPEPGALVPPPERRPRPIPGMPAPRAPEAPSTDGPGAVSPVETAALPPGPIGDDPADDDPANDDDETPRERAERLRALLDPARVARATVAAESDGPILPSGPAGLSPAGERVAPLGEAVAEGRHDRYLGERAAERPELHETAIVLQRHADGSYTWRSSNFTATIHADGSVSFSDRGSFEVDLEHGSASFDLNDMLHQAAGSDPFAAERERFVEENEELITELALAAREADRDHSLHRLRATCIGIWRGSGSRASRRRALFSLWDELSEDAADRAARDAVLAFIRQELPPGSRHGYPDDELEALNAERQSRERFAP